MGWGIVGDVTVELILPVPCSAGARGRLMGPADKCRAGGSVHRLGGGLLHLAVVGGWGRQHQGVRTGTRLIHQSQRVSNGVSKCENGYRTGTRPPTLLTRVGGGEVKIMGMGKWWDSWFPAESHFSKTSRSLL